MTVATWVCCSIISLTHTAYGSSDWRQGKLRLCVPYQASRSRPIARATAPGAVRGDRGAGGEGVFFTARQGGPATDADGPAPLLPWIRQSVPEFVLFVAP